MCIISFQGEHGAYSEQAIYHHFGSTVRTHPCSSFAQTLTAVVNQDVDYAMLPVENALTGTVIQAYDQLLTTPLQAQAEVILPIHHCLLTHPDSQVSDIEFALSHPQALSQCANHLDRLKIKPLTSYDTAGAAKLLSQNPQKNHAAIASDLAATVYGLKIIESHFEDHAYNQTRFLVMGAKPLELSRRRDKTSLIFALKHQPNALANVLNDLAHANINLHKIESRPMPNKPWQYLFFLDIAGAIGEEYIDQAIVVLKQQVAWLKILGSYQAARVDKD